MTYSFGIKSVKKMTGVHPALKKVLYRAIEITDVDFSIIEGVRTLERQKHLVASGASKTLNSRHLSGHAVDIAPYVEGEIRWDWPLYHRLAKVMKTASKEIGVPVQWGGDWIRFKDGPHWQLPWGKYP
jgi:peptidoglycan L-alanyl-D-glutamate endopeptidase CwlK